MRKTRYMMGISNPVFHMNIYTIYEVYNNDRGQQYLAHGDEANYVTGMTD